jgi:sugar transferase (PEP-CTERM/EpsH1 system associated)
MGEILFLAHRMPFPPDRGDKIRSHHLLKALARIAPVHVACFGDTDADFAHENDLAAVARSHLLVRRRPGLLAAGVRALASRRPVSLSAFDDARLREWVRRTLRERDIDTVFVFSGQLGQYVPDDFAGRFVVDLCDVDSVKFDAYAANSRGLRRWLHAREGKLLAVMEARLAGRADCTLLVSEAEAALFRSRMGAPARIDVLRNGVDTGYFDPKVEGRPELLQAPGPHLIFTGQMDYPPNVAAVERMALRIFPDVRRHAGAVFHIVGRAAGPAVRRLERLEGVRVWGEVPDVRPFLAAADLVVAPLCIARGVQNKVLEAMAMARPVLLSPEAAAGIEALDQVHFSIAADDRAFVDRGLALLADGPRASAMGEAARRYVVERQGWDAMLAPLAKLIGRPRIATARHAA